MQPMEAILVKEKLRIQDHALRNHVQIHFQLTVCGANGVIGVLALKLVEQDSKNDSVKFHNFLKMEEDSVLEKLMKQSNV